MHPWLAWLGRLLIACRTAFSHTHNSPIQQSLREESISSLSFRSRELRAPFLGGLDRVHLRKRGRGDDTRCCALVVLLAVVQSVLPIGPHTIMYGTADAAKTVHNKDPELEAKVKQAADYLNLKAHRVKGKVRVSRRWESGCWHWLAQPPPLSCVFVSL